MEQEGNAEQYFISDYEEDAEEDPTHPPNQNCTVHEGELIENNIFPASNCAKNIIMLQWVGLDVDNNYEPSPENTPQQVSHSTTMVEMNYTHEKLGWCWSGIDNRKCLNIQDQKPTIKDFVGESITHLSFVGMFFLFFPRKFIKDVVIIETNKHLVKRMTLGEFLRWVGICFYLSTLSGFSRRRFGSIREVVTYDGAPYHFHDWTSRSRFKEILLAIQYTDKEPPSY